MMNAKRFLMVGMLLIVMIGIGLSSTAAQERAYGDEEQRLDVDSGASGDELGFSVALSLDGSTAVAGAPNAATFDGQAYVFTRSSGGMWNAPVELVKTSGGDNESFGYAVGVSGDGNYAIVGAYQALNGGAAYVFVRSGNTWTQQQRLTGNDSVDGDLFGYSVAINNDGTIAIVGARGDDDSAGSAYVFTRNGVVWSQQGEKLVADERADGDFFGHDVDLSNNGVTAIIGAKNAIVDNVNGVGAAYIFGRSNNVWSQSQQLTASDGAGNDQFGESVSLSGGSTYALVGAKGVNGETGAAYVFLKEASGYEERQKLTPPGGAASTQFGLDVAMSSVGKVALIGAPGFDNATGAGYVYVRTGQTWNLQQELLEGSDSTDFDNFAHAVALSNDGSIAISGAKSDNSAKGSVYAFFDGTLVSTSTPTDNPATSTPEQTGTPNATATPNGTSTPDGTTTPDNPTPTSTAVLGTELVVNGGFEAASLVPWQQKLPTSDKIRCNKVNRPGKPDKIVANSGICAYGFKGGAGENSKIQQNADFSSLSLAVGDTLNFSAYVSASNAAASGKLKVRVKYSDGTDTGKITENILQTSDYIEITGSYPLMSAAVTKIKVQVQNTSTAGKVYVDDVSLLYVAGGSFGLVPLP